MFKKKFSPEAFATSDKLAKDAAIKIIEECNPGARVVQNPYSSYDVDLFLMMPTGDHNRYHFTQLEVEHRVSWRGIWNLGNFVRLPGRKLKLQNSSCAFFILNNECSHAVFIHPDTPYKISFIKTRFSETEEIMMVFDIKDCEMVEL